VLWLLLIAGAGVFLWLRKPKDIASADYFSMTAFDWISGALVLAIPLAIWAFMRGRLTKTNLGWALVGLAAALWLRFSAKNP